MTGAIPHGGHSEGTHVRRHSATEVMPSFLPVMIIQCRSENEVEVPVPLLCETVSRNVLKYLS